MSAGFGLLVKTGHGLGVSKGKFCNLCWLFFLFATYTRYNGIIGVNPCFCGPPLPVDYLPGLPKFPRPPHVTCPHHSPLLSGPPYHVLLTINLICARSHTREVYGVNVP